ncbi:hypothetical protein [Bradyrhizobium sp. NBAIM14]|uniref:hypothetical protein n=1 Tax=Bradyrhizobium sp. NBAIM14 TaxID=2793814 RepID=UPI001CD5FEEB|nr:hypothetical protein [Bradyrhizobium sp. NBAIM14]MCA1495617.1 hypothetical protein [Bradyrhizobium sp. NBAIM14]
MSKIQTRNQSVEMNDAAAELVIAHTRIMDAWFEQWRIQERSRIDIAFRKSGATEQPRRHIA